MIRYRLLLVVDATAHFLYCPTMRGQRSAAARWHHGIHLIPGALLQVICDCLDRACGATEDELRRGTAQEII